MTNFLHLLATTISVISYKQSLEFFPINMISYDINIKAHEKIFIFFLTFNVFQTYELNKPTLSWQ